MFKLIMAIWYMSLRQIICLAVFCVEVAYGSDSNSWQQFRGNHGNGTIASNELPTTWSATENLLWAQELVGRGWSSPVIADGKIWVTSASHAEQKRPKNFQEGARSMGSFRQEAAKVKDVAFHVYCLSLESGNLLWKSTPYTGKPAFGIHPSNTYATESPVTDGRHVYAYFAAAGLLSCLDLNGNKVWEHSTGRFSFGNGFGSGSGLAIHQGKLYLQCDNDESSYVSAIDAQSGAVLWKKDRSSRTSWSTPLIWSHIEAPVLVVAGSDQITGYNPDSGDIQWKLTGFGGSFSGSPAWDDLQLYFGNSGPRSTGPLMAIDFQAKGEGVYTRNQSDAWVAWSTSGAGPGLASPVAYEGYLYVLNGSVLKCYESKTGQRVYEERLPRAGRFAASLVMAGDHLYALDENGKTFVIQAGPEFEIKATNELQDLFWSTPSMTARHLLLRGADRLYCLSKTRR